MCSRSSFPHPAAVGFLLSLLLAKTVIAVELVETESFSKALLQLPSSEHNEYLKHTEWTSDRAAIFQGSTILAAIQLQQGEKIQSFWVSMQLDETTNTTSKNSIGTLYTSTGRSFVFESKQAHLNTSLHGPIQEKDFQKTSSSDFEITVNADYLSLGLHRLHEFFEAVERYRTVFPDAEKKAYTIRSTPFEDSSQLFSSEILEAAQLSEASERAFVGSLPALGEFFNIIYETDGLKDILMKLIPKRSLLTLLNPFNKGKVSFSYGNPRPTLIDATPLNLGLEKVSAIPVLLSFGSKPILSLMLYTTQPSYEWKTCAGIVAIEVHSSSNPANQCFIRTFPQTLIVQRLIDTEASEGEFDPQE